MFTLGLALTLCASSCGDSFEDCNPYKEFDDAFSGAIYERESTISAQDIQELRLYSYDRVIGLPCPRRRKLFHHLTTITQKEELATYLAAINESNMIESHTAPSAPFGSSLGMEFVDVDGRKTFIVIWIYKDAISEHPFPIKKLEYNQWGFSNDILHSLLKEQGVLDAMPGYGEFMAAQKQAP